MKFKDFFYFRKIELQLKSIQYIDYEINNLSKDTLYLILDEFDFLTQYPIIVSQKQEEVENSRKECGGYFIYNRPPSAYHVNIFDPKKTLGKSSAKI